MLNVGPEWHKYTSAREVIEVAGGTTLIQACVAIIALRYLVPGWLDKGHLKTFVLLMLGLLFVAAETSVFYSYAHLEPTYPESYGKFYQSLAPQTLIERLGWSANIKYIVFSKLPLYFFPVAVLISASYYRKQQLLFALREQKRAAELDALKNQLNPHFVFNTLNNIYALAIQRSDQTPEAVEKLSSILDYVLYRCNESFVSLHNEIEMIHDYIALEKLRFGDRLEVSFTSNADSSSKVAPLLILSLLENAFKHGVSQELNTAKIDMALTSSSDTIEFRISNSKPATEAPEKERSPIGLSNLRRQLSLLYPDSHNLEICEGDRHYTATLKLEVGA